MAAQKKVQKKYTYLCLHLWKTSLEAPSRKRKRKHIFVSLYLTCNVYFDRLCIKNVTSVIAAILGLFCLFFVRYTYYAIDNISIHTEASQFTSVHNAKIMKKQLTTKKKQQVAGSFSQVQEVKQLLCSSLYALYNLCGGSRVTYTQFNGQETSIFSCRLIYVYTLPVLPRSNTPWLYSFPFCCYPQIIDKRKEKV